MRRWIAVLAMLTCGALVPFAGVVLVIPAVIAVIALLYRHRRRALRRSGDEQPAAR
ncbi:MAG TPA: hypothetical protein VHV74_12230 [Pseudonocardiaceae bacterium]|nr:hypothetical protein [Pseudonocardiaceae bacterium]